MIVCVTHLSMDVMAFCAVVSCTCNITEVTEFRIAYQRFRQGSHHGAKGETTSVAKTMTVKHAR